VAKLNDELTAILSSKQGQAALQQESFVAEPGPPARLTRRIAADLKKWQDIAAAAGIQAE
jgi:tripartite-type tricarboxylate transporter receptor subunit TctC